MYTQEADPLILFVSPFLQDAQALKAALSELSIRVEHVTCLREAGTRLRTRQFRVILTEDDLRDGGWKDVIRIAQHASCPAHVIVTHPFADARHYSQVIILTA